MYIRRFLLVLVGVWMMQCNVQAQATTRYITHTIRKGETLSVLGTLYKTTVGDIMRLNQMHANSKLSVGQKIKIPVKGGKVAAQAPPAAKPPARIVFQPVPATAIPPDVAPAAGTASTHVVQQGETLYRISKTFQVSIAQLKEWNHLPGDNVSVGQRLAVSREGSMELNNAVAANPAAGELASASPQSPAPNRVAAAAPAAQPAETTTTGSIPMHAQPETTYVDPAKVGPQGYFASLFGVEVEGRTLTDTSGTAMTFKTASGWTDKKYYILINNVAPGSIVKVSAADGSRVIYAKVLWNMNDMRENEGLAFRISNAAAEALGLTETKFQLTVSYYD